jgi:hypothetical protein
MTKLNGGTTMVDTVSEPVRFDARARRACRRASYVANKSRRLPINRIVRALIARRAQGSAGVR